VAEQNQTEARRSQSTSGAINAATRNPGDKLFQLAHTHGEPDGSVTTDHIGLLYAADVEHARTMASVFFFVPRRQLSAWEIRA
jgi:hypothetical protein